MKEKIIRLQGRERNSINITNNQKLERSTKKGFNQTIELLPTKSKANPDSKTYQKTRKDPN